MAAKRLVNLPQDELIAKLKKAQSDLKQYRWRHKNMMKAAKAKFTSWAKVRGMEMKKKNRLRIREQVNALIKAYKDRVSVMDGMFMYATVVQYAKQIKINPNELAYLILLNIVDSINPKDCYKFGFAKDKSVARNWMNRLVGIELAEVIDERYMASVKGKEVFNTFKAYHKQVSATLIKTSDRHRKDYKW